MNTGLPLLRYVLPDGYRWVKPGESAKEGDLRPGRNLWVPLLPVELGVKVSSGEEVIRKL